MWVLLGRVWAEVAWAAVGTRAMSQLSLCFAGGRAGIPAIGIAIGLFGGCSRCMGPQALLFLHLQASTTEQPAQNPQRARVPPGTRRRGHEADPLGSERCGREQLEQNLRGVPAGGPLKGGEACAWEREQSWRARAGRGAGNGAWEGGGQKQRPRATPTSSRVQSHMLSPRRGRHVSFGGTLPLGACGETEE